MDPSLNTFAQRLSFVMDKRNIKAAELARRMGISSSSVYQWLNGETKAPRPDHLFAAADALGVNARWLGTGEGEIWLDFDYNQLAARLAPDDRVRWRQVGVAFDQQGTYQTEDPNGSDG